MNSEKRILNIYNKKYLLPVYSGTLAIEGVLKSLGLNKNDKVLITNVVCYSILQAILNANLIPIIAIPNNGLTLNKEEIKTIVKKEKIKVFIAVHQYGYEQEIVKINNLIVIEDVSQAWNITLDNSYVGENSDYIISSLGSSKPLSNGIGGLIISNINLSDKFDTKKRECRNSYNSILEYYYPLKINYKKIIKRANKKVIRQRRNAKIFKRIFSNYDFIKTVVEKNSIPSYHRYLIYVNDKEYNSIIGVLDKCKINYQKEYKNKLDKINIVKSKKIKTIGNTESKKCILLKTDNNFLNLKKLELEMGKNYGS